MDQIRLGWTLHAEILAWKLFRTSRVLTCNFTTPHFYQTPVKMGSGKKEAARKERQGKVGDGMANVKVKVRFLSTLS